MLVRRAGTHTYTLYNSDRHSGWYSTPSALAACSRQRWVSTAASGSTWLPAWTTASLLSLRARTMTREALQRQKADPKKREQDATGLDLLHGVVQRPVFGVHRRLLSLPSDWLAAACRRGGGQGPSGHHHWPPFVRGAQPAKTKPASFDGQRKHVFMALWGRLCAGPLTRAEPIRAHQL